MPRHYEDGKFANISHEEDNNNLIIIVYNAAQKFKLRTS